MKAFLIFLAILTVFSFAIAKHISAVMYPLSAVLFYLYLPVLYTSSRINTLHHAKGKVLYHIKFYPMELAVWLICTCFLSFLISHLLADLLFDHLQSLYHLTYFLIGLGAAAIAYCELDTKTLHFFSRQTAFERQGLFLSLEIFFIFFLLFAKNH